MRSLVQARKDRRALLRDIERDLRRKDREKLAGLRQAVKDAKADRKRRVAEVVLMCRQHRIENRARAKERRLAAREELRQAALAEKDAARAHCADAKTAAKQTGLTRIERAAAVLRAERAERERERVWKKHAPRAAKAKARERASESDEEVEGNIPAELRDYWRKVRGSFKASARKSRTEAFLEWMQGEGARDFEGWEAARADRHVEELLRKQREQERQMRKSYRTRAREQLSDVPF